MDESQDRPSSFSISTPRNSGRIFDAPAKGASLKEGLLNDAFAPGSMQSDAGTRMWRNVQPDETIPEVGRRRSATSGGLETRNKDGSLRTYL